MFPPLASTSWTEMLMPLLLFANEMLLVTHEFDLKYNTNKVRPPSTSLYKVLQKKKKFIISNRFFSLLKDLAKLNSSHIVARNFQIVTCHWKNNLIVKILFISFKF